jgi:uncharacterized membrane protein
MDTKQSVMSVNVKVLYLISKGFVIHFALMEHGLIMLIEIVILVLKHVQGVQALQIKNV